MNISINHLKQIFGALIFSVCFSCFSVYGDSAPYSISAYKSVLKASKLQAPTSTTLIAQGDFSGEYNSYFYIPSSGNKWMTFEVTGDSMRSELRQMSEWYTSDSKANKMIGEALVVNPSKGNVDELTFMQIHDSTSSLNKPLVRLVWLREYNGVSNHYWAVVKNVASASSSDYSRYDLGAWSSSPMKFELRVQSNLMKVKVNNATKVSKDVSYWAKYPSYFKAGVYNQDSGTGNTQFKSLKYYN